MTTARERDPSPVSPKLLLSLLTKLVGERLEVLPEPTDHDLLQGRPDNDEELWAVGDCATVTDVRTCEAEDFRQRVNGLACIIYSY